MNIKHVFYCLFIFAAFYFTGIGITGCAQIGYPTGGDKDSIPPVLVRAEPAEFTTNFTGNKITLTFDEYIDVTDIQNNVLVSPFPKTTPNITFKLRTVTVKIKDTLQPNTTYAIDFGNALKDLNEANPFRNYTYVFSTGNTIDSLTLSGNVTLAESGKTDSTLIAMLYKNAVDSTVENRKPDYVARLSKEGNYTFKNLSAGSYKLYALKDGDGGKTYNSTIETFAFAPTDIMVSDSANKADTLYAYAEEKDVKKVTTASPAGKANSDKKLKPTTKVNPNTQQSLLAPLEITFNRVLKNVDEQKIRLTDSSFKKIDNIKLMLDSTKKTITLNTTWAEGFDYFLIIDKDAVTDTTDATLFKADTIRFRSKETKNYGNLVLRFTNYNADQHPVLQFLQGEQIVKSLPVTSNTWSDKLFEPGEYDLRILYDENKNGQWDAGNYKAKRQPEKAITLPKKISVRADWDNEKDIEL